MEKTGKNDNDPAAAANAIVVFPKLTLEVSQLLSNVDHQDRAIAVVCGGHSSSNVATWPAFLAGGGFAGKGKQEDERQ